MLGFGAKREGSAMQYVVHSEPPSGEPAFEHPFKAFSNRPAASQFAAMEVCGDAFRASVYEVAADSAPEAVAAVKMGKGGSPIYIRINKTTPGVDRLPTTDELGL